MVKVLNAITLPAAPAADLEASTKKYVDDNIGGGGVGPGVDSNSVTFVADASANTTLTTLPAAEDYLVNSHRHVTKMDLSMLTHCRLVVRRMATAGAAGSTLALEYSTTDPATTFNGADWTGSGASLNIATANQTYDTGWVAMPTGMKADNIHLAIVQSGGDGALSPVVGSIRAYFKGPGASGTKITDLTALTGAGAATGDLIEAVDISDTTMAASGTNKKMTLAELIIWLNANGIMVADDSITNTKIAPMAASTLKGNNTGGTAGPTDLTVAQVQTLLAIAAASETVVGQVELATAAETLTGTDNTKAIHPAAGFATFASKSCLINAQTGTTYTLVLTDADKMITLSNAGAITLTVPANSTVAYPIGTTIDLVQIGAGQVTVTQAGGVTVNATPSKLFRAQFSAATLVKYAADTWILAGDLA